MPHDELTALLPEITGPSGQFRHRQHIHLAFLAVRRYSMPEATTRICDWIQHIAAYERAPQKYHHTVSRAWVEIVAHHANADPDCADFGIFADRHPALLDKRLLARHYRSSTLAAAPARIGTPEELAVDGKGFANAAGVMSTIETNGSTARMPLSV